MREPELSRPPDEVPSLPPSSPEPETEPDPEPIVLPEPLQPVATTVAELRKQRVWTVHGGRSGETVSRLTDFAEAYALTSMLFEPTHGGVAVGLSLDASGLVCVTLMNCYTEDRGVVDGASHWVEMLNSYTECCWPTVDGTSVRILCRAERKPYRVPLAIDIKASGIVTLTCCEISSVPAWRDRGVRGRINDATQALDYLTELRTESYVPLAAYPTTYGGVR
jgi:hypothetical protein